MGLPTKVYTLNPKACSVIELYGFLDITTRDWTDGLLSSIFRDVNKPTDKKERRYILYDGDVDALWIENMVRLISMVQPILFDVCVYQQMTI
jgi:dynein heavy chain, axonemal